ncbi:MAG: hypothetical protein BWY11_02304 [Firmicutes bacterium ADurb.Bin182]|nr:MAG: hypothetical protein BWY11_02304 [Firmicutes bacterium ADurb.Bin182]
MKRRYKRVKPRRIRKTSFKASNWAPVLALLATIIAILGVLALIVFVGLPYFLPMIGIEYRVTPTPSPSPTPRPTPTPRPIENTENIADLQKEVVLTTEKRYKWLGDPYIYNDILIFTAGELIDNEAVMNSLLEYDIGSGTMKKIDPGLDNDHYMFPVFNDKWLVYLDARFDGGGCIKMQDLTSKGSEPQILKEVYAGQPELKLSGDYLAWTERTGTNMDKLFVCDLRTKETTVLSMFNSSVYGQSQPDFKDGLLVWADADTVDMQQSGTTSTLYSIRLSDSTVKPYKPGTYVHDPEYNGSGFAWLSGHHGPGTELYYSKGFGMPVKVDEGVVEFGMGSDFIAYCKDETMWVYLIGKGRSYRLTPERERAQFLGVSDDKVLWMDVTSRERDIMKFAPID